MLPLEIRRSLGGGTGRPLEVDLGGRGKSFSTGGGGGSGGVSRPSEDGAVSGSFGRSGTFNCSVKKKKKEVSIYDSEQ